MCSSDLVRRCRAAASWRAVNSSVRTSAAEPVCAWPQRSRSSMCLSPPVFPSSAWCGRTSSCPRAQCRLQLEAHRSPRRDVKGNSALLCYSDDPLDVVLAQHLVQRRALEVKFDSLSVLHRHTDPIPLFAVQRQRLGQCRTSMWIDALRQPGGTRQFGVLRGGLWRPVEQTPKPKATGSNPVAPAHSRPAESRFCSVGARRHLDRIFGCW